MRALAAGVALAGIAACGGAGTGSSPTAPAKPSVLIAVNVPSSADPYVAGIIKRGAQLAVDEAAQKGITINGVSYTLTLKVYDDNGDPQQAASNVDAAIRDGAVAIITDGIGSTISAGKSQAAGVPEIDITNGDTKLLTNRPSIFRLGIPDDAAASVMGGYIASHTHAVAIVHDDTAAGRDGSDQLSGALQTAGITPSPVIEVPANLPTLDTQFQQIASAHVGGIAIWGSDVFIARAVTALRATGATTPVYTSQGGEAPAVRQLAGPAASEGLTLVTGRMTSESDSTSFGQFEKRLAADGLGPTDAGFKNAAGQEIRQPNDIDFFSYDAARLVIAALQKQNSVTAGPGLLQAISTISIKSANGDARGFDPQSHEAFAAADVYLAVIHDMQFYPVKDDKLSASLPRENQILSEFH